MRIARVVFAFAAFVGAAVSAAPAYADLRITVDKSLQLMTVDVDGRTRYVWPVSTGAPGYDTPSGQFTPFRMEADHFSKEWDDAPMPNSIFFTARGHAIHGSSHKSIGRPASHGCVRLEPKNAATLFALVKQAKMANTRIVLTGETPVKSGVPVARQQQQQQPYREADRVNRRPISNDRYATTGNDDDGDYTGSVQPQRRFRIIVDDRGRQYRVYDEAAPRVTYEAPRMTYDDDTVYARRRFSDDRDQFGWPFGR